jgi:hypothetical protein
MSESGVQIRKDKIIVLWQRLTFCSLRCR